MPFRPSSALRSGPAVSGSSFVVGAALLLALGLSWAGLGCGGGEVDGTGNGGTGGGLPGRQACGNGVLDQFETCDEGAANGTPGHCKVNCSGLPAIVSVEGDVLPFLTEVEGARISGATVSVLEHPEMTVVTGDDAHFRFDGLEEGSDVTLLVEHPDYKTTQTATVTLGAKGIHPFPVQVVPTSLFGALSALVPLPVEEETHCVIATTVARMGGSLYVRLRQGMPDVAVSLSPSVLAESGPIYFDESALPNTDQPSTSIDGGALFYRVLPGDYVMSASKAGTGFADIRFQCRAGIIVNAGPPMGPLANVLAPDYGLGNDRPGDDDSAATDALCEATSACVNEKAAATNYPEVTVASCKAMFRNTWAFVDATCDASRALRDAARAFYLCRAATCTETLGDDDVCVTEEAAFRSAETTYGACLNP